MALSTSTFLLCLYVFCETIRANYAYYAFRNFQISGSAVILLSEIFKLSIAAFFLWRQSDNFSISTIQKLFESSQKGEVDFNETLKFATPAALYLINNLIYYTVLPLTNPSLLQVCIIAKLPTTGILHHYMIKPQKNVYAWFSLLWLGLGLFAFNIPSGPQDIAIGNSWYLAPVAGFVIACLSALASISSETSTKEGEFWESQAYLYIWGVIFATIAYPIMPGGSARAKDETTTFGFFTAIVGLVIITGGTGLVVAVVLRARDNILRVIGTAVSLVTIAVSQFIFMPDLRASTFTPWKVCGGGIVATATWCYNHYSQEPWPPRNDDFHAIP
jgi:UDP-sugar transporter A1/2/3